MDVARKRAPDNPEQWADDYLRAHEDAADLRAIGRCRSCGASITLAQIGRCVYSSCDHYRAQGDLARVTKFLRSRELSLSPERRESLLALLTPGKLWPS